MSLEVFSREGVAALGEALVANEAYRTAAADWEGSVLLEVVGDEDREVPAVYLDLWRGDCRTARLAEPADRERADYVITAPRGTWEALFGAALDPLTALFGGKLRLERGRILDLAPHLEAVRRLIAVAIEVNRSAAPA